MRLGVILDSSQLPSIAIQTSILQAHGCDEIFCEGRATPYANRRLARLLLRLKRGDELVVHSLEALDLDTGELIRRLSAMVEVGVGLRIAFDQKTSRLFAPDAETAVLLAALAEHERRRLPSDRPARRRRSPAGGALALTSYQIEYARRMYMEGASPRSIGLLFQASPDDIWRLVGE